MTANGSPHPQPSADGAAPPRVSVVIPTCNRRVLLERCLQALADQTFSGYEVIVVDDHSDDGTLELLEQFSRDHPHLALSWLSNPTHLGANPSRNRGIAQAKGQLVAFLDSDCMADPRWLEKLVPPFDDHRVAAVTGRVDDLPPSNIFELTFKGTHHLNRPGPAPRLIAGNMCVRRDLLIEYRLDEDRASQPTDATGRPDVSVSGRGDEEGLFLMLRAAGYRQLVVPDAAVRHEHHLAAGTFFRQAYRGGRSAARLVYKYHLPQRLDLLPFILAYATLPLMLVHPYLALLSALFFAAALGAITYNDLFRKRKTVFETLLTFPCLLAYYHVRLTGYVTESLRLRLTRHNLARIRLSNPQEP